MKKVAAWIAVILVSTICMPFIQTQEREDRTLLNWDQMRAIINEASGERALHHVLELVPYPRVRSREEYQGHFRESIVMEKYAREYGYSNVEIESFPSPAPSWYASQGELWMVAPESRKLYDIYDVAVSACSGSESGDLTADLVDVGIGARPDDYAGKDVKGKIVLGSAGAGQLQRLGVIERGAVGVLSYTSLRADSYPDEIMSQSISANAPEGKKPGFGWSISPRVGRELALRLAQGGRITLRSVIKSETFPGEMETVHAVIPGDGSSEQEVAVSAHLYEGYIKQGANDDNSGCAMTLEMGRAFMRLVQEGKLPRPKRTIHFLWVPEISGTMAWLNKHQDIRKKLVADLNFDMEGLGLRSGLSSWILHRTPDTFPTFLNDLCASVLEFVGNLNRERVRYRHNGYRFTLPVVAPNGSQDPFYYVIDKFYGASDHVVYINQGIPSAMFVTWPDMYYHSSQDTPDKLDSTMFKRAAVVGAAAMTILATAGDDMASKVTAESLARGAERMGESERKGLSYLADVADSASLLDAYKEARNAVRHQAKIEEEVVRSSSVLYKAPEEQKKKLAGLMSLIDQRAAALLNEAKAYYELQALQRNIAPQEPALTGAEAKASRTIAERVGGGGFGGRGGFGQQAMEKFSADERTAIQAGMRKVPTHMTSELNILLGQKKTIQEIRDFLSGEFEPLPLGDLMDYLRAQEKLGSVKLTEKPEEPKPVAAPAPKAAKPKKKGN